MFDEAHSQQMSYKIGDSLLSQGDSARPQSMKYRATVLVNESTGLKIREVTSAMWLQKYKSGTFTPTSLHEV